MASIFNSKHNKYVSIPDWFKDTDLSTELPAETKTTYIGGASGAVASGTGMSDIVLHNKFILKEVTASSDILVIQDTALNVIESAKNELTDSTTQSEEQTIKIGDELLVIGWGTSAYIEIAAGSTMTINASISELYGLVFYDNTKTVISGVNLSSSPIEVVVPINASYYRISSELNIDSFSILYQKPIAYNSEQLETSNLNITDYVLLNEEIPEGINTVTYTDTLLKLLVQSPLSLTKDINNVVKLSIGEITTTSSINDMFVWDKKLAAFGYDTTTGTAYSYIDGQQLFTTDEEGNEIPVTTTNSEFWLYDDSLENLWIIKSTRPRISWLDNLVEYNDEKNCFIFHGNVLTTGGITMYAEDGDIGGGGTGGTIPNLEELKKLFVTTDDLVQSITGIKTFENGLKIGTSKLYFKDDIVWLEGNLAVTGGITMYAQQGDIEGGGTGGSLLPGTIEEMVNALTPFFVTVDDLVQNVTGIKHFENGIYIGSVPIKQTSEDVIYIEGNLFVKGGITMYSQDGISGPITSYDNLPIDGDTIYWNEINGQKVLSAKGSGAGTIGNVEIIGSGNAITNVTVSDDGKTLTFEKDLEFPSQDDIDLIIEDINNIDAELDDITELTTKLNGDLTELILKFNTFMTGIDDDTAINKWHELESFLNGITESDTLVSMLALKADKKYVDETFVTLTTEQTITGKKNFTTGGLFVNGSLIIYNSSERYWKLNGDLLITGGVTMYADSSSSSSTLMDALILDPNTLEINSKGQLTVIGGTGGGGIMKTFKINDSTGTELISYNGSLEKTLNLSKAHVGLPNVENTALSTWTGSGYIRTVGTITSGTWNGSTIAATYLPTATTSTKGIASFDSSWFSVSRGIVSFTGANVKIVSSLPSSSSRVKNTLYVITE